MGEERGEPWKVSAPDGSILVGYEGGELFLVLGTRRGKTGRLVLWSALMAYQDEIARRGGAWVDITMTEHSRPSGNPDIIDPWFVIWKAEVGRTTSWVALEAARFALGMTDER